jgi:hypothetical protein
MAYIGLIVGIGGNPVGQERAQQEDEDNHGAAGTQRFFLD